MHIVIKDTTFGALPFERCAVRVNSTVKAAKPATPTNTSQTLRPALPLPPLSSLPTSSVSPSPMAMVSSDENAHFVGGAPRVHCFWALIDNNDLRFVYVSRSVPPLGGPDAIPDSSSSRDTTEGVVMPAGVDKMTLREENQRSAATIAVNALCSSNTPSTECDRDLHSYSQWASRRVDHRLLVNTSFFEHLHPEEVATARADLAHFVAQKTLYGAVTRCRFRVPEAVNASDSSISSRFSPESPTSVSQFCTSVVPRISGASDYFTPDSTWQKATVPMNVSSSIPPIHTIPSSYMDNDCTMQINEGVKDPVVPNLMKNDMLDDEFVVMDVAMNVVCSTLTLAFFHVVSGGEDKCHEAPLNVDDIMQLERLLTSLTPPNTPAESHPSPPDTDVTSSSTRVLQILSADTGSLLLAHPAENLKKLTANTTPRDTTTRDWLSHLYQGDDYRKLREKIAEANKAVRENHGVTHPVYTRLKLFTPYGHRETENVLTSWAGLTFICTQLASEGLGTVAWRDDRIGTSEVQPTNQQNNLAMTDSIPAPPLATSVRCTGNVNIKQQTPFVTYTQDSAHSARFWQLKSTAIEAPKGSSVAYPPPPAYLQPDSSWARSFHSSLHLSAVRTQDTMIHTSDSHFQTSSSFGNHRLNHVAQPLLVQKLPTTTFPHSFSPPYCSPVEEQFTKNLSANGLTIDVPKSLHSASQTRSVQQQTTYSLPHFSPNPSGCQFKVLEFEKSSPPDASPLPTNVSSANKTSAVSRPFNAIPVRHKDASRSGNANRKQCESCGTMRSPEWRRGPSGHKTLCNACGLRYSRSLARAGKAATQVAHYVTQQHLQLQKHQQLPRRSHQLQHPPPRYGRPCQPQNQHYQHTQPLPISHSHRRQVHYPSHHESQPHVMSPPLSARNKPINATPSYSQQHSGSYSAPQHWSYHRSPFDAKTPSTQPMSYFTQQPTYLQPATTYPVGDDTHH